MTTNSQNPKIQTFSFDLWKISLFLALFMHLCVQKTSLGFENVQILPNFRTLTVKEIGKSDVKSTSISISPPNRVISNFVFRQTPFSYRSGGIKVVVYHYRPNN